VSASQISRLSFLQPDHITANVEACRKFACLPTGSPAFLVVEALLRFPNACFESPTRHQRVTERNLSDLRLTLTGLMGGEFPKSFAFIDQATFERQRSMALAAELRWSKLFPADYAAYDDLVGRVVYAYRDGYSGGSVSNAIGWIWLSPESDWDEDEFFEDLVHEYVHNVLFLEEMVHTLFALSAAEMAEPENRVVSAIRRIPRYFDQAYHAAAVALVLSELALKTGRTSAARLYIDGLLPSLDALRTKQNVMSAHGNTLLREMIRVGLSVYDEAYALAAAA
jgi:hypothetical protein